MTVVRRVGERRRLPGGIIIPDTAKEKPQQTRCWESVPGKRDETGKLAPLNMRAGDQIGHHARSVPSPPWSRWACWWPPLSLF